MKMSNEEFQNHVDESYKRGSTMVEAVKFAQFMFDWTETLATGSESKNLEYHAAADNDDPTWDESLKTINEITENAKELAGLRTDFKEMVEKAKSVFLTKQRKNKTIEAIWAEFEKINLAYSRMSDPLKLKQASKETSSRLDEVERKLRIHIGGSSPKVKLPEEERTFDPLGYRFPIRLT